MIDAKELRQGSWIADRGGKQWQIDCWETPTKVAAAELPKGYSKKDYLAGFHQCYEWVIRFVNKTKTTPTPPKH